MASFFFSNPNADGQAHACPSTDTGHSVPARRHMVTPPARFTRSQPRWRTLAQDVWRWIWDLDDSRRHAAQQGLAKIKGEFMNALWDVQSSQANRVRDQIEVARSLRELWHLRADVFDVLSVHRGQIDAQARLDLLDSHFPIRAWHRAEGRGKVASW